MITKKGTVTKISGQKTIKVEVNEYRSDPKYHKRFSVTKNIAVHDETGSAKEGQEVSIRQCKPISKRKTWEIVPNPNVAKTA